ARNANSQAANSGCSREYSLIVCRPCRSQNRSTTRAATVPHQTSKNQNRPALRITGDLLEEGWPGPPAHRWARWPRPAPGRKRAGSGRESRNAHGANLPQLVAGINGVVGNTRDQRGSVALANVVLAQLPATAVAKLAGKRLPMLGHAGQCVGAREATKVSTDQRRADAQAAIGGVYDHARNPPAPVVNAQRPDQGANFTTVERGTKMVFRRAGFLAAVVQTG